MPLGTLRMGDRFDAWLADWFAGADLSGLFDVLGVVGWILLGLVIAVAVGLCLWALRTPASTDAPAGTTHSAAGPGALACYLVCRELGVGLDRVHSPL